MYNKFSQKFKEKIRFNELESFKKKVSSTKHGYWFEALGSNKQFGLFMIWKRKKHEYKLKEKSISLNKFIFDMRDKRSFSIPKNIIREHALNKLLN